MFYAGQLDYIAKLNGLVAGTTAFAALLVGVGVSWAGTMEATTGSGAIQVGDRNTIQAVAAGNFLTLNGNARFDGANWKYIETAAALTYQIDPASDHYIWYRAPSGTAGTTATFAELMRLTSTGLTLAGNLILPGATQTAWQINFWNSSSAKGLMHFPLTNFSTRLYGATDKLYFDSDKGGVGQFFTMQTDGLSSFGGTAALHRLDVWGSGTKPSVIANTQMMVGDTSGFANAGLALVAASGNGAQISFGHTTTPVRGTFAYDNTGNYLTWGLTTGVEAMRLSTTGLGVGAAPQAKLYVRATTDQNLEITPAVSLAGAVALGAVNDAHTLNTPMEFRASIFGFYVGKVGIGLSPSFMLDVKGGAGNGVPAQRWEVDGGSGIYVELEREAAGAGTAVFGTQTNHNLSFKTNDIVNASFSAGGGLYAFGVNTPTTGQISLNGAGSGTGAGSFFHATVGGSTSLAIGNYSAIHGGAYNSNGLIYTVGDLAFTTNASSTIRAILNANGMFVLNSVGSAIVDMVSFYSTDDAPGHTIPSFYCEGTNVTASTQPDSPSSVRIKMRINGVVQTFLCL